MKKPSSKTLTAGLKDYLTPRAQRFLQQLIEAGFDEDLAFIFMEKHLSEKELWDIPNEQNDF